VPCPELGTGAEQCESFVSIDALDATNALLEVLEHRGHVPIAVEQLELFDAQILNGLKLEKGVIPGAIRDYSVGVPGYRGAPHQDCKYLLTRLCDWLNGDEFAAPPDQEIAYGVLKSVIAHIYIAWIHPFGDGNGRTARLLEVKFLLEAGVPSAAAHLLSNHYNLTRAEYSRQLDLASRSGGDVLPFIEYAVQGFADQLREQLKVIRKQQWDVAWINVIHEILGEHKTEAGRRQRKLVLALSQVDGPVSRKQLQELTPELTRMYAERTGKTLTRDLNALLQTPLIKKTGSGYRAQREMILAFLPRIKTEQFVKALAEARTLGSVDVSFLNHLDPAA
jgi:Fic family protein